MKPLKRLLVAGLATHPSLRRKLSTCNCTPWWFPNASGFSSDDQKRGSLFFLSVVRNSLTSADGSEVLKLVNQVIEQRSDLLEVQLCEVIDMGGNFLQSFARTLEGVLEMRVSPGTTIACLAFTRFVMEELSTAGHATHQASGFVWLGGSEKERKGGRNAALVSSCDVCLSPGSRSPGCCQSNRTTTRNG